jgi:hypothetical protein
MALIPFIAIGALGMGALGYLVAISPGRVPPLVDAADRTIPGSLSERVTVQIGGVAQTMILQSADPANPVLLFLHGGPGMPEFFMEQEHPSGLATHVTLVWWDQRGAACPFRRTSPLKA